MLRIHQCAASLAVLGLVIGVEPAAAQFGGLFGAPPRPPSSVPSRPANPPVQPQQPGYDPTGPQNSGVQSQPLPPPGSSAQPLDPQSPVAGLPPNQRQLRGTQPGAAPNAPQPSDEVITELPSQKITNPTAIFAGLDKITGRIISFDVAINETVQFGALQVTPRVCYTRPPTETPNTDAFIEVDEVTLQGEVKRIFSGWIFASSPGLHAVEHAIYDVWLADCKGGTAVAAVQPGTPTPGTTPRTSGGTTSAQQRQPGAPASQQQQRQPPRPPQPAGPMVPPRN
jgi:hypothetical protein